MHLLSSYIARLLLALALINACPMLRAGTFGSLTYEIFPSIDAVMITGYVPGNVGDLVIPNQIEGRTVTRISDFAFNECSTLTSIVVPESINFVGWGTFKNCTNLTRASLPTGEVHLGHAAFEGCKSLARVNLPRVQALYDWTFMGCAALVSIELPDSISAISGYAFAGCTNLVSVNLPPNITYIGPCLFSGCQNLENISIPPNVALIGNDAFSGCVKLEEIVLPSKVNRIMQGAFAGSGLKSIEFSSGLRDIDVGAFSACSALKEILLPEGLLSIGWSAFERCISLTKVRLPTSLKTMQHFCFQGCISLASLEFPNGLQAIDGAVCQGCTSLTKVIIPRSVTSIVCCAFRDCPNLEGAYFKGNAPANFGTLGGEVFDGTASSFKIKYLPNRSGFSSPTWNGYASEMVPEIDFWRQEFSVPTELPLDDEDANQDGISTLMAYALDLNPFESLSKFLPNSSIEAGSLILRVHTPRANVNYIAKSSSDMQSWSAVGITQQINPDWEFEARYPLSDAQSNRRLMRLDVSLIGQ